MKLDVMYRGPLSSCNYACGYCPFAKRRETREQLRRDRASLGRFVDWLRLHSQCQFAVLFTPWGEALVRSWYRRAIAVLTHEAHIRQIAVQTNLSMSLGWVSDCDAAKLALWATYHPGEVSRARFLRRVRQARARGVAISVGMVATPDSLPEIQRMRAELPGEIYLWINAQRPPSRVYTDAELAALGAIDPYFPETRWRHRTRGLPCWSGETSFTVDGDGHMRRCHFVAAPIGNIYDPDWLSALQPRGCPRATCECFLGLANLKTLTLRGHFGDRWIGRQPLRGEVP